MSIFGIARSKAKFAALLTVMLVACTAAPAAQSSPTGSQGASATPTAAPLVPVRLGHNRAFPSTALLIGLGQGHFTRAGVTVTDTNFPTAPAILTAVQSGDLDFGLTTTGAMFLSVTQGVKLHAVALLQGMGSPSHWFAVRADSGINSVADLKGKKAAIPSPASGSELYMRHWLGKAGLDIKDLVSVSVPFAQVMPAIANKQVDFGVIDATQITAAQQQYPGQLKPLTTYEEVAKDAYGEPVTNSAILVVSDSFLEKNRPTVVAFLEAYLRAVRQVNADPKKALSDWSDVTQNAGIKSLPGPTVVPNDGKVYLTSLQWDADQLLKYGYLKQAVKATDFVDNKPIEEAAARIK
jgi:NitT/TauT family transport system substrate-binding protein